GSPDRRRRAGADPSAGSLRRHPSSPSFPSASPTGIRPPHRREPSLPDRRPSAGNSPAPDHDAAAGTPGRGSSLTASSEERRRGAANFSSARFAPKVSQGGTSMTACSEPMMSIAIIWIHGFDDGRHLSCERPAPRLAFGHAADRGSERAEPATDPRGGGGARSPARIRRSGRRRPDEGSGLHARRLLQSL